MENNLLENRFGYEPIKRKIEIKKLTDESKEFLPIFFRNEHITIPIIKVNIGLPVYRLSNGRTLSFQEEYVVKHKKSEDFFMRDIDSVEAQMAQHSILVELSRNKDLFGHFKKTENKQTEAVICTNNGIVINGNRRISCWRDLYYNDPNKYRHFQYINVAILPECDEDAIEDLEHQLQIAPDMKDPYCWHAEAKKIKILRDVRGLTKEEIAEIYTQYSPQDIDIRIDMFLYAEQYLEKIDKAHLWSYVTKDAHAFEQFVKNRKAILNPEDKILFQELSFATIFKSEVGRLYGKIPEIKKYLPEIKSGIVTEFSSSIAQHTQALSVQLSILGIPEKTQVSSAAIAKVVSEPDKQEQIVELCEEIIDGQKLLEREAKDSNFLVEQVRKANTILKKAIAVSQGRSDISTVGLQEQIMAIEISLNQLRIWKK